MYNGFVSVLGANIAHTAAVVEPSRVLLSTAWGGGGGDRRMPVRRVSRFRTHGFVVCVCVRHITF